MSKAKLLTFLLIFLSFSAVFCFYNFETVSAQGVVWTYNADTNTARASGSGSTNFAALVAADTAGGWGKFTADATGTQIICAGKIVVGDGRNALTWADTNKQVYFTTVLDTNGFYFEIKANANVTFGTLSDLTTKQTSDGCSFYTNSSSALIWFMFYVGPNGIFNLYSSTAYDYDTTSSYGGFIRCYGTSRYWNCQLNLGFNDAVGDLYNTNFQATSLGRIRIAKCTFTVDKITVQKCNIAFYAYKTYIANVSNSLVRGATYIFQSESTSDDSYLTNVDSNVWNFDWVGTSTGKIYRQYTFNLNVLNGEITDFVQNANVTLYKDNVKVYSGLTNSSGMIPTQTLTYGYYQQSTGNTIQNATSPYYLVISHPDWQTYVSRFYITQPLRLTVSMQEPTYTGYNEAEKSDYTTIILFVISLILCIIGLALTVPLLPLISLTISVINIIFLSEPSIFNILLIVLNVTFTLIALVRAKTKNN